MGSILNHCISGVGTNRKGFQMSCARVLWWKHRGKVSLDMVHQARLNRAVGTLNTVSPFCQAAWTMPSWSKSAWPGCHDLDPASSPHSMLPPYYSRSAGHISVQHLCTRCLLIKAEAPHDCFFSFIGCLCHPLMSSVCFVSPKPTHNHQ